MAPDLTFDERMMHRAIGLARRGQGRVEPNPMVGCVIVKQGQILGEGFHRRFGGPHAEIEALRACRKSPRGATVYVTLEPCCYAGKTPPCVDALIEAKVARVVLSVRDPNPLVNGGGVCRLEKAGIEVSEGLLSEEGTELIAPFRTLVQRNRPYVIAKWAQSLDGKLCTRSGDSHWISSDASRQRVHEVRARVDAVVVGIGTVLSDDPILTARDVPIRRVAARVVLDTRLRLSPRSQLVQTASEAPILVLTALQPTHLRARRLMRFGVEVLRTRTQRGRISIKRGLEILAARGAANVLVEGGAAVLTSFFAAGVVDEALVFTAPLLIGGSRAPSALLGAGAKTLTEAIRPSLATTQRIGPDILHRLLFRDTVRSSKGASRPDEPDTHISWRRANLGRPHRSR